MRLPSTLRLHQWVNKFILFMVFYAAASASFNGFFTKWTLRDQMPEFSIERMLDGTADRPFVYRQLLPYIANRVQAAMSPRAQQRFIAKMHSETWTGKLFTRINSKVADDPRYMIRYHVVYYLSFLFLFAAMFATRRVCLAAGFDEVSSSLAPLIFALFFPFLETVGGYYYDLPEVFFLMAAMALAMGRSYWWLLLLTPLATWNKESFLLFLPAQFPLMRTRLSVRRTAVVLAWLIALSVAVNVLLHMQYRANPGRALELHFFENLRFYLSPGKLFGHEVNYGILTLRGYNVASLLLLWIVIARGWRGLPASIHFHTFIAAAINLPLFFVLCFYGELRDLSMLYGALLLLIAACIAKWVKSAARDDAETIPEEHIDLMEQRA